MTLDVTAMRQHVTTPLEDDALGRLVTAAYEAIDDRIGAAGDAGELLHAAGDLLVLSRRAESITAITEIRGPTSLALDEDDYELRPGGRTLRRLASGTNPAYRWRGRNDVRYTRFVGEADRDRVAIALVKLDSESQPGVVSERLGDHSVAFGQGAATYTDERAAILDSLYGETLVLL